MRHHSIWRKRWKEGRALLQGKKQTSGSDPLRTLNIILLLHLENTSKCLPRAAVLAPDVEPATLSQAAS